MDPITLAAIGGGIGLARGMSKQKQAERDRKMSSEIARWSPWTGMQAPTPYNVDPLDSVMQGGMTGAMLGQSLGSKSADPAAGTALAPEGTMSQGGFLSNPQFDQMMAQKYPWLAMNQ